MATKPTADRTPTGRKKRKRPKSRLGTFRKRNQTPVPCQRCGRNLWTVESQRRGFSPACYLKQLAFDERKARITQQYHNLNLFSEIEMAQFEYKVIDLDNIIIIQDVGGSVGVLQNIPQVLDYLRTGLVDEPSNYLLLVRGSDQLYDLLVPTGHGYVLEVLGEKDEEIARKRAKAVYDLGAGTNPAV
jgi:hypothetical protein